MFPFFSLFFSLLLISPSFSLVIFSVISPPCFSSFPFYFSSFLFYHLILPSLLYFPSFLFASFVSTYYYLPLKLLLSLPLLLSHLSLCFLVSPSYIFFSYSPYLPSFLVCFASFRFLLALLFFASILSFFYF